MSPARRRIQRPRPLQPKWKRPRRLTPDGVQALAFLRNLDPLDPNSFLQDVRARALADPLWTPTIRQEQAILRVKAEREQR